MKAIETYYNGYRFRSRLEARWAVFFDEAGLSYEYEPEGFHLDNGAQYLPDFYLPLYKCYVEVKHRDAFKIEYDREGQTVTFETGFDVYGQAAHDITWRLKRNYAIVFGDPVDVFSLETMERSSHLFTLSECAYHIRAMGDPENEYVCATGESCSKCNHYNVMASGQWCGVATFNGSDFLIQGNKGEFLPNIDDGIIQVGMLLDFQADNGAKFIYKDLIPYAKKARQARFEHGEAPTRRTVCSHS